jgi:hypothetical protein
MLARTSGQDDKPPSQEEKPPSQEEKHEIDEKLPKDKVVTHLWAVPLFTKKGKEVFEAIQEYAIKLKNCNLEIKRMHSDRG